MRDAQDLENQAMSCVAGRSLGRSYVPIIALLMACFVSTAKAQENDIADQLRTQDAAEGAVLYAAHCAVCHGSTGKGDGDMASVLTIPSPDLTLLSKNNAGTFPLLDAIHIIDGRTGVRAHGGVMPVFGAVFSSDQKEPGQTYGTIIETRGRVLSLALYLESIQQQ